jgi:restriction endonuclease S subunit
MQKSISQEYYLILKKEAQPNISKDIVVKTDLNLPPLATQKLIVAQIEAIFAQLDDIEKELKA